MRRGAEKNSDHMLVAAAIKMKLTTNRRRLQVRIWLILDRLSIVRDRVSVGDKEKEMKEGGAKLATQCSAVIDSLVKTRLEKLGNAPRKRRSPCFDGECKTAVQRARAARMQ